MKVVYGAGCIVVDKDGSNLLNGKLKPSELSWQQEAREHDGKASSFSLLGTLQEATRAALAVMRLAMHEAGV